MLDIIKTFLESDTPLPKIIVVYGPTACGKSAMAVEVAKSSQSGGYDPHIISADSRQVYRGLDIGTGKVTEAEMQGIPHHMLDVIEASEKYSMVDFRKGVDSIFDEYQYFKNHQKQEVRGSEDFSTGAYPRVSDGEKSEGDKEIRSFSGFLPILCGGTGLYIDAVLYNMAYPENPPDWKYREELEEIRQKEGNEKLWQMLHEVDPEYASELEVGNYRYIMRGLEVIRDTGKSKRESHGTKKLRFSPLFLTPYTDSEENRKNLYTKIDDRVREMFHTGLIEEIFYNIGKYGAHCPGLETIGYKEVVAHLEGRTTLEEAISLVQQHSRNYAKRQITWNKRYL